MTRLTDMEQMLQQLTSEGDLSAHGQFTLDPGKSRSKIAQFLQTDRSSWAGWLVRAAHALGASEGEFQLGRETIVCRFDFPTDREGLAVVYQWLAHGNDPGEDSGLHLLRTSLLWLQALMEGGLRALVIVQGRESASRHLGVDDVKSGGSIPPARKASLSVIVQGDPRAMQLLRQDMSAHLPPRLCAATMPLRLDGRALNPTPPAGELLYAGLYLGAGKRGLLGAPAPARLCPRTYHLTTGAVFRRPRFSSPASVVPTLSVRGQLSPSAQWSESEGHPIASWQKDGKPGSLYLSGLGQVPGGEEWGGWLVPAALFRRSEGQDVIRIVDRGLLLDEQPFGVSPQKRLGWTAWVAWDGVQTDLSGTKPVDSTDLDQLKEWLRREIYRVHTDRRRK